MCVFVIYYTFDSIHCQTLEDNSTHTAHGFKVSLLQWCWAFSMPNQQLFESVSASKRANALTWAGLCNGEKKKKEKKSRAGSDEALSPFIRHSVCVWGLLWQSSHWDTKSKWQRLLCCLLHCKTGLLQIRARAVLDKVSKCIRAQMEQLRIQTECGYN